MALPTHAVFGDRVRIRSTEPLDSSVTQIERDRCGARRPLFVSGIGVISGVADDAAINVHIGDTWFAPDLVDLLDHRAGSVVTVAARLRCGHRTADGAREPITNEPAEDGS